MTPKKKAAPKKVAGPKLAEYHRKRDFSKTKGPSLDPSVKRLAMEVEDHPIESKKTEDSAYGRLMALRKR